jgi:hypothetical protein
MDMRVYAQLIKELQDAIGALEGKLSHAFNDVGEDDDDDVLIDEARVECSQARRQLGAARETLARYQGLKVFEEAVPVA